MIALRADQSHLALGHISIRDPHPRGYMYVGVSTIEIPQLMGTDDALHSIMPPSVVSTVSTIVKPAGPKTDCVVPCGPDCDCGFCCIPIPCVVM